MVAYFICSSACQSPQRDGRDNTNFKFGNRLCSGFHARNCERELAPSPGRRERAYEHPMLIFVLGSSSSLLGTMSGHISRCQSPAPLCAGNGLGAADGSARSPVLSVQVQNVAPPFSVALASHPSSPLQLSGTSGRAFDRCRLRRVPRHRGWPPPLAPLGQ